MFCGKSIIKVSLKRVRPTSRYPQVMIRYAGLTYFLARHLDERILPLNKVTDTGVRLGHNARPRLFCAVFTRDDCCASHISHTARVFSTNLGLISFK